MDFWSDRYGPCSSSTVYHQCNLKELYNLSMLPYHKMRINSTFLLFFVKIKGQITPQLWIVITIKKPVENTCWAWGCKASQPNVNFPNCILEAILAKSKTVFTLKFIWPKAYLKLNLLNMILKSGRNYDKATEKGIDRYEKTYGEEWVKSLEENADLSLRFGSVSLCSHIRSHPLEDHKLPLGMRQWRAGVSSWMGMT